MLSMRYVLKVLVAFVPSSFSLSDPALGTKGSRNISQYLEHVSKSRTMRSDRSANLNSTALKTYDKQQSLSVDHHASVSPANSGWIENRLSKSICTSDQICIVISRQESESMQWMSNLSGIPAQVLTEPPIWRRDKSEDLSFQRLPDANTKPLTIHGGSTRECGGYLSFIIKLYSNLPKVLIFCRVNTRIGRRQEMGLIGIQTHI
eukprot:gnl/MRDRNA2_/MRDRNA2_333944_c0_seq1.p1 gnl/MRDRNA2_/MRDRNA2_333944_c0~~gnl/MRDRNA2_/MRDRNA2_333944_c0_seq1.p1  ORF type:complete len:205 (+),score=18.65 gnl/MRDRNA2_/MRDRNA2_333944_c0_seq1:40-654(+)